MIKCPLAWNYKAIAKGFRANILSIHSGLEVPMVLTCQY